MASNRISAGIAGVKTIHMIGHAHIDPVWLWQWQEGMDEVLTTFRTACDLLDEFPDFVFSQGEAWTYRQVELVDPELFDRIRLHVRNGRWEIAGGWWVQPDCNLPTAVGFDRQIQIGKDYFQDRFGLFPEVACNVDSFGHAASLPEYMRSAGQKYYVMMRPGPHELSLPARLFRWRSREGGDEVLTYRLANYGNTGDSIDPLHLRSLALELPEDMEHTVYFYGVGDHGGGPTAANIQWIMENQDKIEGCHLVFSTLSEFFEAIAHHANQLPMVTGELQPHSIGCYSVERGVKTLVRRAEHALHSAELVNASEPHPDTDEASQIRSAWERVCFNQFHDTLAGTCIPSAYRQCYAQLGYAASIADDILAYSLRRKTRSLPDDPLQRVVLFNASDSAFDGFVEFEPWTEWRPWLSQWQLLDADNKPVPYQLLHPEAAVDTKTRLMTHTKLKPGEMYTLKIDREGNYCPIAGVTATSNRAVNQLGIGVDLDGRFFSFTGLTQLPLPRLQLIEDRSDTWSHDIDRYSGETVSEAVWSDPSILYNGPIVAALLQNGVIGQSRLQAEWCAYSNEKFIELKLRVHWMERQKVLKLCLPLPTSVTDRIDGIPGFGLRRENDGVERPIMDWTMFSFQGKHLGIVCPETFALDASPEIVRFTLLRSPLMAHHVPATDDVAMPVIADQGQHDFLFRFHFGEHVSEEFLNAESLALQRKPLVVSVTRGMPKERSSKG